MACKASAVGKQPVCAPERGKASDIKQAMLETRGTVLVPLMM